MKPELTTVLSPHLHLYFVQAPSLFRDRDYMLVAGMQAGGGRHHHQDITLCTP